MDAALKAESSNYDQDGSAAMRWLFSVWRLA